MNDFVNEMSGLTGKSIEDLTIEFSNFMDIVNRQYSGRLEGDELTLRSEQLFKQKCRAEIKSDEASGAVPITMYVSGISDTQDKIQWQRNKIVDIYKLNPNKAIMEGRINEYRITDNGIMKRSFDRAEQKVVETMVEAVSPNAEVADENILIAPVDTQKIGFGGKENKTLWQEMPLHKYSCYVYGFAEIDGSDDMRWTKYMLRGNNAIDHGLEINKIYSFKAINMTDKDSEEYNFIDTDKFTYDECNWDLFNLEEVIKQNFIESRIVELGNVDAYLKNVEQLRESRKFSDWNVAILVEADVAGIYPGKDGNSDRLYVDDDSLRWGDNDNVQGNINSWVSKSNVIDFGEYSRVLLTCFPSRGKPPKDSPDGTQGKTQLNVYGIYAFLKYKTMYEPKE